MYTLQPYRHYLSTFDGSFRLFMACWREYLSHLKGAIDAPESDSDVANWLDAIASTKVNNPRSTFYMYG